MNPEPKDHPQNRSPGFGAAFFIVAGSMIGTGIFTTSGFIIEKVHNPFVVLAAWVVGGSLALSGAFCYGELGAMFPSAGGDYVFLREAFGKKMAFLSGWISLIVGFSAPIAAAGFAFGGYAHKTLPAAWQPAVSPLALSVAAIVTLSWIHALGLKNGSRTQNILTASNLILIVLLVVFGLSSSRGALTHFGPLPAGPGFLVTKNFFSSCILVWFAFCGYSAVAYVGGEVSRPERNIPRAILVGTLFVTVLYLLLNVLFVYAVEPARMAGVQEIGRLAAVNLLGEKAGTLFGAGIALTLLSCLSAMIITGPRVYYAMACDGVFFAKLGRLHPRHGVPVNAIILQAALAVLLVLTATFYSLLIYIGSMLTLFSSLTVLGMLFLRARKPEIQRPCKTWGYPLTPCFFIAGNFYILWAGLQNEPKTLFWGAFTLGSGLVVYHWFRKRSSGKITGEPLNKL